MNSHMRAVYTSNDTRKPSTFVKTLLNFSFPLIGWPFNKLVCLRSKGMGYSLNTSANHVFINPHSIPYNLQKASRRKISQSYQNLLKLANRQNL